MLLFLGVAFGLTTSGLLAYHVYLIWYNQTTIESLEYRPVLHPTVQTEPVTFDKGPYANFVEVFGPDPRYWLLPTYPEFPELLLYVTLYCLRDRF